MFHGKSDIMRESLQGCLLHGYTSIDIETLSSACHLEEHHHKALRSGRSEFHSRRFESCPVYSVWYSDNKHRWPSGLRTHDTEELLLVALYDHTPRCFVCSIASPDLCNSWRLSCTASETVLPLLKMASTSCGENLAAHHKILDDFLLQNTKYNSPGLQKFFHTLSKTS